MIVDFGLLILTFLISSVSSLLPVIGVFPVGLSSDVSLFVGYIYGWDWILPIDTIFFVLRTLIILVLAEFTYFVAMYVIGLIHSTIR